MDAESSSWLAKGAEALVFLGSIFGVNKWMNAGLNRRVKAIEDSRKEEPKRTVSDCRDICESQRRQADGMTEWLKRVEDKLDRVIMERR